MNTKLIVFFAKTPFIRLLIPLVIGICLQWYLQFSLTISLILLGVSLAVVILFNAIKIFGRLKYKWVQGLFIHAAFIGLGMMLVYANDIRHNKNWFDHFYSISQPVVVSLTEQPVEKQNSYKAEANVISVINDNKPIKTKGEVIIYFKKDSTVLSLKAGTTVAFAKPLQEVKNSGNPGAFDFKRYSLFNGITHQVYLTEKDFEIIGTHSSGWLQNFLIATRNYVLETLKKYIPGKKEQGLAEALLIGYKDDLDKNLLQSYTNTGVVHVIAVSGMHLTLLYWILNVVFTPFVRYKKLKWLHPVLILGILWMFSFLTGGAASIIRAAVMFSFIIIGKVFSKNASIYNTLAASAFFLLCYNPYWLWDVGFQLSYAAVLSIVIFFKPVYNLQFFKNKIVDNIWKLIAVSIAAQILTMPFTVYHFHQFPIYFLLTNLVAVPLSSLILVGELVLVLISPLKTIAVLLGKLLSACIFLLDTFIERVEQLPFALWDGLYINILQACLLFIIIAAISVWLMQKYKIALWIALVSIAIFSFIRYFSFYATMQQNKIIVYNVPKYTAIDFVDQRNYFFYGDTELLKDNFLRNFHLKPARIKQRLVATNYLHGLAQLNNAIFFNNKKIIVINSGLVSDSSRSHLDADLVVLSGNPRLYIADMVKLIMPKQVVIDGSVPAWKAKYWRHDCDSLQIACHDVSQQGAFVMNIH